MEILKINLPYLDMKDAQLITAGLRPIRSNGIRFEEEKIKNKHIYHNYGHGGAGVSLAPGCAKMAVLSFERSYDKSMVNEIAVLGSGYMGLFTAKILAEKGFNVTLYAQNFPFKKPRGPCYLASEAAGGYWMPYNYGLDEKDKRAMEFHDLTSRMSFDYYQDCVKKHLYQGIRPLKVLYVNVDPQTFLKKWVPISMKLPMIKKMVSVNNAQEVPCTQLQTFMMEGPIFLNELMQECWGLGVKFVEKQFSCLDDVLSLDQRIVFNCLGLGSKEVFSDNTFAPLKGQIVWFKPTKEIDFYICYQLPNGQQVTCYPHKNLLGVGLTKESILNVEPDKQVVESLVSNWNQMVKLLTENQKPKL